MGHIQRNAEVAVRDMLKDISNRHNLSDVGVLKATVGSRRESLALGLSFLARYLPLLPFLALSLFLSLVYSLALSSRHIEYI